MKNILENGSSFPLEDISEVDRLGDIQGAIAKGNHKSASNEREQILTKKMEAEVTRGWTIPLLRSHITKLPLAMLAPLGLTNQATINEKGEVVYKDKVTHDLSHKGAKSGTSINSRIIHDDLPTLQYGHLHSRTTVCCWTFKLFPPGYVSASGYRYSPSYAEKNNRYGLCNRF